MCVSVDFRVGRVRTPVCMSTYAYACLSRCECVLCNVSVSMVTLCRVCQYGLRDSMNVCVDVRLCVYSCQCAYVWSSVHVCMVVRSCMYECQCVYVWV